MLYQKLGQNLKYFGLYTVNKTALHFTVLYCAALHCTKMHCSIFQSDSTPILSIRPLGPCPKLTGQDILLKLSVLHCRSLQCTAVQTSSIKFSCNAVLFSVEQWQCSSELYYSSK